MARFYGGGLERVLSMCWVDVAEYATIARKIEGEERRAEMIVAAYPMMDKGDRERVWRQFGTDHRQGPERIAAEVERALKRKEQDGV